MNPRRLTSLALALLILPSASSASDTPSYAQRDAQAAAQRGVTQYLAAHYAEALPDLEKATQEGVSSGPLLYMLGFCYDFVQHDAEKSAKAYADAQQALDKEVTAHKPEIESFFYLSNLHLNRGSPDLSKKAAEAGTAAIESKRAKVGKDGTSLFRAGKLYSDAGKTEQAVAYHRRAVAAFKKQSSPPPEYYRRALETVVRASPGKTDPNDLADIWEAMLAVNPKTADGDWNLGLATLRAGRYVTARDAFERVRKAGGDHGEDGFYATNVASAAGTLTGAGLKIPTKDRDGKALSSLDEAAIDERIKARAQSARDVIGRQVKPNDYKLVPNKRGNNVIRPSAKFSQELGDAHRYFLALAIEIVTRGLPIQSKAFADGYAPLIIQDWERLWSRAHADLQAEVSAKEASKETKPDQP